MRNNWRKPINEIKVYSCEMSSEICNQELYEGTMRHEFYSVIIVENAFILCLKVFRDFLRNLFGLCMAEGSLNILLSCKFWIFF